MPQTLLLVLLISAKTGLPIGMPAELSAYPTPVECLTARRHKGVQHPDKNGNIAVYSCAVPPGVALPMDESPDVPDEPIKLDDGSKITL